MSAHTPGPWIHYDHSNAPLRRHQIVALGKTVSRIYCTKGCEAEDVANARLIASAPELLAALKDAVDSLEYVNKAHPEASGWGARSERIAAARAAIAKAEGR